MSISEPAADSGSAPFLAEKWRTRALSAGWLHPDDWHGAAVGSMVLAVLENDGAEGAASELGADRASRGVGLTEGLADLAALYESAHASTPPFTVAKAFAEAWVDVATAAILARGSTDSLTGLRTADYLEARMREVYAQHRETGVMASDAFSLIVISGDRLSGWRRVLRSCSIARVVTEVLAAGQSNAILPSGSIVSIAASGTAREHAARIRHRLLIIDDAESVTVEVRALPESLDEALAVLAQV